MRTREKIEEFRNKLALPNRLILEVLLDIRELMQNYQLTQVGEISQASFIGKLELPEYELILKEKE